MEFGEVIVPNISNPRSAAQIVYLNSSTTPQIQFNRLKSNSWGNAFNRF